MQPVRLSTLVEPATRELTADEELEAIASGIECSIEVRASLAASGASIRQTRTMSLLPMHEVDEHGARHVIWYAPPKQISAWGKPVDVHVEVSRTPPFKLLSFPSCRLPTRGPGSEAHRTAWAILRCGLEPAHRES